jgi:hypothetical protein
MPPPLILETPPTIRAFLVLILIKGIDLFSCLIYYGLWEKLVVEFTQQVFPRCERPRCIGIQPLRGSIMKGERKRSKVDNSLEKFWNLVVAHIFLNFFTWAYGFS